LFIISAVTGSPGFILVDFSVAIIYSSGCSAGTFFD